MVTDWFITDNSRIDQARSCRTAKSRPWTPSPLPRLPIRTWRLRCCAVSDDTRKVEPSPDGAISPAGIFVAPATDRATGRPAPQTTEPVDCSAVESVSTAEPISPSAGRLPRPSDETWLNSDNRWPPSFENDTVHPGLRESRLRMSSCWQVLEAGSAVVAPRAYCARPVVPGPGLQHPLPSPRLLAGSLNPRSAVRRQCRANWRRPNHRFRCLRIRFESCWWTATAG